MWHFVRGITTTVYHSHHPVRREKHESLASWISQHGCDILALQEVKVKKEVIRDSPNTVDAELAGWDTFWCPCQLKGNLSGFNGVAVFAKKGLTIRADCAPFGEQELDDEGRCTTHMMKAP